MFDIEYPFLFADRTGFDYAAAFAALSPVDQTCLVGILVRARYARAIGVNIPIDKLLNKEPLQ